MIPVSNKVKVKLLSHVRLFVTPRTVAYQAPQSMGFFQARRLGCHFLLQGIFLTQGSNPGLPHCRQTLYRLSYQGSSAMHAVTYMWSWQAEESIAMLTI